MFGMSVSQGRVTSDNQTKNGNLSFPERQSEEDSPAYSRAASVITYNLKKPGLNLEFSTGPYEGSGMTADYPRVDTFRFAYNPSELSGYPDIKISLGSEPIQAGIESLDFVGQSFLINRKGDWLEFHFNSSAGSLAGGAIFVNRDSGKFVYVPPKSSNIIVETGRALLTQSQFSRKESNSLLGNWEAES